MMKSVSGTVVEVFEWKSQKAIDQAHQNPEVLKMWEEYAAVCDYEIPVNIEEFGNLFSEFEPMN